MTVSIHSDLERRLLVFAPFGKDSALIEAALRNDPTGCSSVSCSDADGLRTELERGVAALMIAEEALPAPESQLTAFIEGQGPWSDLPVLILTRQGANSAAVERAVRTLGNVSLLERPVRIAALTSAVRSALRARMRQYEMRAYLEEREDAARRKDEFLATLAHELRNPLAPIMNSVQLLRYSGVAPKVPEMVERQVKHMVRLIDDLMEVSRITRGKIQLRKSLIDLATPIHAAIETSRPLIESAHHRLTITLPQEPMIVEADATRLAQVFCNLLNNATKYTNPGGVISVEGRRENDCAVVTVSDTGVGIPRDALARIFDMFVQADARAGDHAQGGLGIGLTLAKSLVELHGGTVTASSDGVNKGSRFAVRLPLVRVGDVPDAAASETAESPAIGKLQRILVVDDNRDAADSLGSLLQRLGADVRVEYGGQAALNALDAFRPTTVFLDLGMPEINGIEVARRIRQRQDSRGITLIALTGWGQEQDRLRTEAAGFDHHLVKPLTAATMQTVLTALAG